MTTAVSVSSIRVLFCLLQAVSLEKFRSLQEKLLLLDFAVSAHDGNVITAVTLFTIQSTTTLSLDFINYLNKNTHHACFHFRS